MRLVEGSGNRTSGGLVMAWLFSNKLMDSVSLPCLQEQEAESSAANSLDGAQCALWSGKHTQPASWLPAKTTDACRLSRSGMTFKPLTDDLGEAVLMSFLEDFPARTSAQQEKEPALTESAAECGDTWRELSVRFDRNTSSWKTHLCLWDEDLPESSVTLPKWGMMRDGVLWERAMLPPLTSVTESGSWPTPRSCSAMAAPITPESSHNPKRFPNLETVVGRRMWPTPRVGGEEGYETVKTRKGHRAAPNMSKTGTNPDGSMRDRTDQLPRAIYAQEENNGGQLNPNWVEWLMGWPIGWTDLNVLEMDKFLMWPHSHGDSLED